jgi:hypothetical protein
MTKVFMWARVAVEHGAGLVKRSIAPLIMTRPQGNGWQQRIIMTNAVDRNQGSKKKITVVEDIVRIVRSDGEPFVESNLR